MLDPVHTILVSFSLLFAIVLASSVRCCRSLANHHSVRVHILLAIFGCLPRWLNTASQTWIYDKKRHRNIYLFGYFRFVFRIVVVLCCSRCCFSSFPSSSAQCLSSFALQLNRTRMQSKQMGMMKKIYKTNCVYLNVHKDKKIKTRHTYVRGNQNNVNVTKQICTKP